MSVKEQIELGILAHGGSEWQSQWCECDAAVGASPCRYCAVYYALLIAKRLNEELGVQQEELHQREDTIAQLAKAKGVK